MIRTMFPTFIFQWDIRNAIRYTTAKASTKTSCNEEINDSDWKYPLIPSLTETLSNSDDTFITACNSFQLESTLVNSCCSATIINDGGYATCSAATPEGLMPRRSFRTIRKELGISMEDEYTNKNSDVVEMPITSTVLPPHDIVTEKSWRTAQSHSIASSTQPSHTSFNHFASWSTNDHQSSMQVTAQSPVLHPTRTRTAVGAAVAEMPITVAVLPPHDIVTEKSWRIAQSHSIASSQQPSYPSLNSQYHHHFSSWSTYDHQSSTQITAQSLILHPTQTRTAVGAAVAAISDSSAFQPWYNDNSQINSSKFAVYESIDKRFVFEQDGKGLRTPDKPNPTRDQQVRFSSKNINFADADGNSSIAASPSSRARDLNQSNCLPSHGNELNISFNSNTKTVKIAHNARERIIGTFASEPKLAVHIDPFSSNEFVPGMNERIRGTVFSDISYAKTNEPIQVQASHSDKARSNTGTYPSSTKARHQRTYKEELICASFERLRDNLQLVIEVEKLDCLTFEKFLKTSISQKGVLTGFSKEERQIIIRRVSFLLTEIEDGTPVEEFFFSSPSHVEECASCSTHHDLTDALNFCKKIARLAVAQTAPNSSGKKWILLPEIETALGILQSTPSSQAPQHNHGHREENEGVCTPMTSNVSIATTLTSTVGTSRAMFDSQSTTNGLHLRHTIVMLSTSFQKLSRVLMSISMDTFSKKSSSIHAVKQLKSCYFDLLDINLDNVNALLDSFRLGAIERPFDLRSEPPVSLSLPPLNFRGSDRTNVSIRSGNVLPHRRQHTSRTNYNRFAPATVANAQPDDLRRRAGSHDRDVDDEEIRDACEPDSFEENQNIVQRGSSHTSAKLQSSRKAIGQVRRQ